MKLSKRLIRRIVDDIKHGLNVQDACSLVKIGTSTYYRWLAEGRTLIELIANDPEYIDDLNDYEEMCVSFIVEINKAESTFIQEAINELVAIAKETKNPSIWFWLLERKFPSKFGKVSFRTPDPEELDVVPTTISISNEQQGKDDEDAILGMIAADKKEKDKTNDPTTDTNDA